MPLGFACSAASRYPRAPQTCPVLLGSRNSPFPLNGREQAGQMPEV